MVRMSPLALDIRNHCLECWDAPRECGSVEMVRMRLVWCRGLACGRAAILPLIDVWDGAWDGVWEGV